MSGPQWPDTIILLWEQYLEMSQPQGFLGILAYELKGTIYILIH